MEITRRFLATVGLTLLTFAPLIAPAGAKEIQGEATLVQIIEELGSVRLAYVESVEKFRKKVEPYLDRIEASKIAMKASKKGSKEHKFAVSEFLRNVAEKTELANTFVTAVHSKVRAMSRLARTVIGLTEGRVVAIRGDADAPDEGRFAEGVAVFGGQIGDLLLEIIDPSDERTKNALDSFLSTLQNLKESKGIATSTRLLVLYDGFLKELRLLDDKLAHGAVKLKGVGSAIDLSLLRIETESTIGTIQEAIGEIDSITDFLNLPDGSTGVGDSLTKDWQDYDDINQGADPRPAHVGDQMGHLRNGFRELARGEF